MTPRSESSNLKFLYWIGRFHPEKNPHLLLDSMKILKEKNPDLYRHTWTIMVGATSEQDKNYVLDYAKKLEVEEQLCIIKWSDRPFEVADRAAGLITQMEKNNMLKAS